MAFYTYQTTTLREAQVRDNISTLRAKTQVREKHKTTLRAKTQVTEKLVHIICLMHEIGWWKLYGVSGKTTAQ